MKSGLAIHVHHDILAEYCWDYDERVEAIKRTKPKNEQEIRLNLFRLLPQEAINELPQNLVKAYAEWPKAYAEWYKAYAECQKADAKWQKAYAEWPKAYAEWYKAYAECQKADAKWQKADVEWLKADAKWDKAKAEWLPKDREAWHKKWCGCKEWNGTEIVFPK